MVACVRLDLAEEHVIAAGVEGLVRPLSALYNCLLDGHNEFEVRGLLVLGVEALSIDPLGSLPGDAVYRLL
jgi:hypothetical protein